MNNKEELKKYKKELADLEVRHQKSTSDDNSKHLYFEKNISYSNNKVIQLILDFLRLLGLLCCAASHPVYLILSYLIITGTGMATKMSTNVYVIYPVPFCVVLVLFAIVRYIIFYHLHPKGLGHRQLLNRFILVNLPGFYFLGLFKSFLKNPMEGNGLGFMIAFFFFFILFYSWRVCINTIINYAIYLAI